MPKPEPVPAPNPNVTKLSISKGYQPVGKSPYGPEPEKYVKPEKWISAGGVVVAGKDDFSQIYIRKPSNNFGPWAFAKGKIEKGESPPKAALREVEEEMGVVCSLVPGGYLGTGEGGFSITHYYLMYAVRNTGRTDKETEEVRLVTWDEALHTLARAGNSRDVKITARALDLVERLRKKGKVP
jgi:8-oxo-dGTP pyrophosphatase MutT (NUDIX family)